MSLAIEEKVEVKAPVDRVWRYLIDPHKVVTCLPGAALDKIEDERTFLGNMKVKVGPVTVTYKGRAKLVEVDDAAHRVVMTGEGTEQGGAGSAKMRMESSVESAGDGVTRILVKAEVDLVGRLVQFGRGMVQGVAKQLFKQFSTALREDLETPEPAAAPAAAAPEPAPAASAEAPLPVPVEAAPVPAVPVVAVAVRPRTQQPVRALPLLFRALWDAIARFFRRLFGRAEPPPPA
jgi:carbon monoxide dehydrogenase subunit G